MTKTEEIADINVSPLGIINYGVTVVIKDGDNEIAREVQRRNAYPSNDLPTEPKIKSIAEALWTDEIISNYQKTLEGIKADQMAKSQQEEK